MQRKVSTRERAYDRYRLKNMNLTASRKIENCLLKIINTPIRPYHNADAGERRNRTCLQHSH